MGDCSSTKAGTGNGPKSCLAERDCSPIDLSHLDRYTLGDSKLQEEVLALFAGQLASSLHELRSAETADAWLRAAHTLKGSSQAVGAISLASAVQDSEKLANPHDANCRRVALARIESKAREVAAFLSPRTLA